MIILGLIIAALGGYIIYLRIKRIQIISINKERQAENQRIAQDTILKEKELARVKEDIVSHNEIVNSLTNTAETLKKNAEKQAEESARIRFEEKNKELEEKYQAKEQLHLAELKQIIQQVQQQQDKLDDLEAKQLSYIQAQWRQEAIAANEDYYRLALDEYGLNDINLLRDLQKQFSKKEIIDKIIWESYYKPAYDQLMSHLFSVGAGKTCGIYKITDLTTGQAYVGQSIDVKERFRSHIKTSLSHGLAANKLYSAMKKSGQHNFTFEILEEVPREKLNEREAYWINFYKTKEYGLNGTKGNKT